MTKGNACACASVFPTAADRQVKTAAARLKVTAAPTFIYDDQERIAGSRPIGTFRNLLNGLRA